MCDYLIIGAGFSGLAAARTILACEPEAKLRILDGNKTIGGNWALEHIYPELQTNNLRGAIDFTDYPMHDGFGVEREKHVPGTVVHEYVKAYAHEHGLMKYISFETMVRSISKLPDQSGWRVEVISKSSPAETDIDCQKLIVATGANNNPHTPPIKGDDEFEGLVLHSSELGKKSTLLTQDKSINRVAVLGGGKSAYDAAYLAARNGKQVEWIIRKTGKGPVYVFPAFTDLGPFKHVWKEKLARLRIVACLSYWLWDDSFSWVRWFFHRTFVGKIINKLFWNDIQNSTVRDCRYAEDTRYAGLVPDANPSWYGTTAGAFGYDPDLYSFIKNDQIKVRREDISHLSKGGVHLTNGTFLPVDALVAATGFSAKLDLEFSPPSSHSDLGIPSNSLSEKQHTAWKELDRKADLRLAAEYPALMAGPFPNNSEKSALLQPFYQPLDDNLHYSPWRLYRCIAPPGLTARGDRSLVFIGMFSNIANTIRLELQCLWMMAYFQNRLSIKTDQVLEETSLMSRYARWRTPLGHGRFYPDLVFEQISYFDQLMQDLGLKHRRKGSLWREFTEAYSQNDYKGVIDEWLAKERDMDTVRKVDREYRERKKGPTKLYQENGHVWL